MAVADEERERRETMATAMYRIQNGAVVKAYGTWSALAGERTRKQNLVKGALTRMRTRMLALVYDAWAGYLERKREVEAILLECGMKIMMRLAMMVWGAWAEYLEARRRCKAIASRIEGNHELGQMANGFAQWIRRAEEKADQDQKLRRSIGFLAHRVQAMAYRAWVYAVVLAAELREQLLPIANRIVNRLIAFTYYGWVTFLRGVKEERMQAKRAIGLWMGKLSCKCFLAWSGYRHRRIRHREENEQARYAYDSKIASSHLRAWHGAWHHRHVERSLMRRSIAFMVDAATMKCINTWKLMAQEANHRREALEGAYERWRSRELRGAFEQAYDHISAERDAIAKGRACVARLMNRALTKGMVTWVEYSLKMQATLEAMRSIGETVINRGKRAAFNTLIEVWEQALHLQHSRQLIALRQARGILMRWGAQGQNYRTLISSLHRLTQRDLTRGWSKWVGDWREAHAVQDRAMARAGTFVARALHFESARGFMALRAAYERVLELRVMLRRVQNPRAIGMLRRWSTLAGRAVEQMRKLRHAYAIIVMGTITRVVREWRTLVAKRNAVKHRVAMLIGKMVNAVFLGWTRYTSKRVACRHAGEYVSGERKARAARDWLVKWRYAAHLSGALSAGLRSYFLRSTFSVFAAWASYTAEQVADRACADALDVALADLGEGAFELLDHCARRWRRFEEASAWDFWAEQAHFASVASVFTGLAVKHSASSLARWAFREYAFAVKVQVEERAAGLFWEHGKMLYAVTAWKQQAYLSKLTQSKQASAIFHFVGRLQHLIFLRWADVARHWRNRRLGTLAAKLHFEGTLTHRLFYAWEHYVKYISWRFRQTQAGLVRHWISLERGVFSAWKESVSIMRGLRSIADGRFLEANMHDVLVCFERWKVDAGHDTLLDRRCLRDGRRGAHRFVRPLPRSLSAGAVLDPRSSHLSITLRPQTWSTRPLRCARRRPSLCVSTSPTSCTRPVHAPHGIQAGSLTAHHRASPFCAAAEW